MSEALERAYRAVRIYGDPEHDDWDEREVLASSLVDLSPDEAATLIEEIGVELDPEKAHVVADQILLAVVRKLGAGGVAEAWARHEAGWWYA